MRLALRLLRLVDVAAECKAVDSSDQAPIHQYYFGQQYHYQLPQTKSVLTSNGSTPVTGFHYLLGF